MTAIDTREDDLLSGGCDDNPLSTVGDANTRGR